MHSNCERCGGELTAWDERIYVVSFYGSVTAVTCMACHNDIVRLIETHPRWHEVLANDVCRTMSDYATQKEIDERLMLAAASKIELSIFFHDYVRSLLPYQVKAAKEKEVAT